MCFRKMPHTTCSAASVCLESHDPTSDEVFSCLPAAGEGATAAGAGAAAFTTWASPLPPLPKQGKGVYCNRLLQ